MKEERKAAAIYLLAATGLIVISFSLSLPIYHLGDTRIYTNDANLDVEDTDETPRVLDSYRFLLFSGIIFGWIFLVGRFVGFFDSPERGLGQRSFRRSRQLRHNPHLP